MKLKMPVDFLNPRVQKTTSNERDDWFVPIGEGVREEKDPTIYILDTRHEKAKKVIKTILLVIGTAIFVYLGYLFFQEYYR